MIKYAYKKGTFTKSTELEGKGSSKVMFSGAVTSTSAVEANGSYDYTLNFLEEGDYEICFANYRDDDQDGEFTFDGFPGASIFLLGDVTTSVSIEAGIANIIELNITGILK